MGHANCANLERHCAFVGVPQVGCSALLLACSYNSTPLHQKPASYAGAWQPHKASTCHKHQPDHNRPACLFLAKVSLGRRCRSNMGKGWECSHSCHPSAPQMWVYSLYRTMQGLVKPLRQEHRSFHLSARLGMRTQRLLRTMAHHGA